MVSGVTSSRQCFLVLRHAIAGGLVVALLAGCTTVTPQRRHTPASPPRLRIMTSTDGQLVPGSMRGLPDRAGLQCGGRAVAYRHLQCRGRARHAGRRHRLSGNRLGEVGYD